MGQELPPANFSGLVLAGQRACPTKAGSLYARILAAALLPCGTDDRLLSSVSLPRPAQGRLTGGTACPTKIPNTKDTEETEDTEDTKENRLTRRSV